MGLLSFLFGGKRAGAKPPAKRDPGADIIRVAPPAQETKTKQPAAKPAGAPAPAGAPSAAGVAPQPATATAPVAASAPVGAMQVKLRLRLASATRAGDLEAAYEAARALEDIQRLAGRRVSARLWREQAERIYAEM